MACDRVQFSKKSHGDNGSLPPCWNRKKPELQSQAHKHKQCQAGIFAKYRANLAPGKTFAKEESGSGNMKAAFQCVGSFREECGMQSSQWSPWKRCDIDNAKRWAQPESRERTSQFFCLCGA